MKLFREIGTAALLVAITAAGSVATASTIRADFNDASLPSNDDGSTGLVAVGFDLNYFGVNASEVYINNNGNITLDSPLSTFTPFDLTATGQQIIAPFFADVDTRGAGSAAVTYGTGTVDGRDAFGVNWVDVGYFASNDDPLNSFQLVLIDRSDTGAGNFDFEFNYGDILWETGTASGGNSDGLGGASARAGFSNGTGVAGTFFEIDGSAVNGAFLNGGSNALNTGSNIGEPGRYLFSARNGTITQPPVNVVPLPAGGLLLLSGLGGIVLLRRKRPF